MNRNESTPVHTKNCACETSPCVNRLVTSDAVSHEFVAIVTEVSLKIALLADCRF